MVRPIKNKILVTRLEGHGIETVTPGGIVLPATREKSVRTKADYFRARVDALGPDAERAFNGDLKPDDEVLVYTYSGTEQSVFTGRDAAGAGLFIEPDDILCAVEGRAVVAGPSSGIQSGLAEPSGLAPPLVGVQA